MNFIFPNQKNCIINTYQHNRFYIYFYVFNILQTYFPKIPRGHAGEEISLQIPPPQIHNAQTSTNSQI